MNQAFIFIGRSGSGKGTQANLLSAYLKSDPLHPNSLYIQSGDEFRRFIEGPSHTAELSKKINNVGGLQPEFLATYMWTNILVREYTGKEHLIFDGMPRKVHEAGVLHSVFDFYGIAKPNVIYIHVESDWSTKHLLLRARLDDTEKQIQARLEWFEKEVAPTVEFYRHNPFYNFIQVDGSQPIEAVHQEIIKNIF